MCVLIISGTIYTATVLAEGWKNVICSCAFRRVAEFPFWSSSYNNNNKETIFFLFFSFFCGPTTSRAVGGGVVCNPGPAVFDEGYNIIYRFPFTVRTHCLPGPKEPTWNTYNSANLINFLYKILTLGRQIQQRPENKLN